MTQESAVSTGPRARVCEDADDASTDIVADAPTTPPTDAKREARDRKRAQPYAYITLAQAKAFSAILSETGVDKHGKKFLVNLHIDQARAFARVGVLSKTGSEAIRRYERGECTTREDEKICSVLSKARQGFIEALLKSELHASALGNKELAKSLRWRLEKFDPSAYGKTQTVNLNADVKSDNIQRFTNKVEQEKFWSESVGNMLFGSDKDD